MRTASGTDGSRTSTGVKRRSRAGSFSMCLRYSSWVVAPMQGNSPRASAALSSLAASCGPSPVEPAPTTVCTSSMKTTTRPAARRTSSLIPFSFSEKEPRSWVPARTLAMSSSTRTRPSRAARSRWATPSTMAVLPTPGSPTSSGLLVRRLPRMSMVSSTSRSRPTSGSSFPSAASSVRFRAREESQGKAVGSRACGEEGRTRVAVRAWGAGAGAAAGAERSRSTSGPRAWSRSRSSSSTGAASTSRAGPSGAERRGGVGEKGERAGWGWSWRSRRGMLAVK